jgi:RNA polymerase sigma factor (TIGR02999 family)
MEQAGPGKITGLLKAWVDGDTEAQETLIPLVYQELRGLARYYRRKASAGETMRTTALVHEAYLRLVGISSLDFRNRGHFFALSAQLMRRILVDAARARAAGKRGGESTFLDLLDLDEIAAPGSQRARELIALDDSLTSLAQLDPRRARTIELRVFGGLTPEETAEVLGLSVRSVLRDWKFAKAWLLRELSRTAET